MLLSIRYAHSYKDGKWLIATFCGSKADTVLSPVIEIGWDDSLLINEASRWRAVILREQKQTSAGLAGSGSGSYYQRAKLPYGAWRIAEDTFELKEDWLVSKEHTLLADYPHCV